MWIQSKGFAVRISVLRRILFTFAIVSGLLNARVVLAADEEAFNPVSGNPVAPKLALHDMDGKLVDLKQIKGKVVIVNFWATWCPPCRAEMPSLQRLWKKLGASKIQIVAVNVGEDADTVLGFMGTLDESPTFPIVFDKDSATLRAWPVRGLPTTFLIDKKGHIAYRAIGGRHFDSPENIRFITAQIEGSSTGK